MVLEMGLFMLICYYFSSLQGFIVNTTDCGPLWWWSHFNGPGSSESVFYFSTSAFLT